MRLTIFYKEIKFFDSSRQRWSFCYDVLIEFFSCQSLWFTICWESWSWDSRYILYNFQTWVSENCSSWDSVNFLLWFPNFNKFVLSELRHQISSMISKFKRWDYRSSDHLTKNLKNALILMFYYENRASWDNRSSWYKSIDFFVSTRNISTARTNF